MINKWLKFNQLLFSPHCILCEAVNGGDIGICSDCHEDLPWHTEDQCPQCGLLALNNERCGQCIGMPPDFDAMHAVFRYELPIDSMLQRYKYSEMLSMADTFAALMISAFRPNDPIDLLIPMPLHPQRLKERGFNQSLEIARILSRELSIPLNIEACQRIKLSPPQASLPYKERIKNMKGAFQCDANLSGKTVVLLDDVITTGASLHALAKAVKSAGATHVECWTIARTLAK